MGEQVFSNVKILDLTHGIAGPYCTKLFSSFGADVIKVEKPDKGDVSREMGPFPNDEYNPEKSGTFFYLNTNKKSITVNVRRKEGVGICKRLLETMDVLVESFAPGGLTRLGLSKKVLKEINPRLIVTSISAFGKTGPYRNYKANNLTSSALGGAMHLMRPGNSPKKRPVIQGGFQAEYSTGLLSYIATVAALIGRADSGGGASVDMSMMECVATTLMGHVAEYPYLGLSRRTNPFAIHGYPIGYSVPCRDGWISLTPGIGGAPNIPLLIGRPELLDDPLFTKTQARMAEPEKFDGLIIPWLSNHDKWNITAGAQAGFYSCFERRGTFYRSAVESQRIFQNYKPSAAWQNRLSGGAGQTECNSSASGKGPDARRAQSGNPRQIRLHAEGDYRVATVGNHLMTG